jgi:sulfur-carrier protein
MPSIKIPTPLRVYTGGESLVNVGGTTVGESINELLAQYPELKPHLFNGDSLRSFVNIFIGEEDIRFLDGLETSVESGDNLRIIPSIAGGRRG